MCDFVESTITTGSNNAGWANFSAFDQDIQPAANPLLVSSAPPSNKLEESGSDDNKIQTKINDVDVIDDIKGHKSKSARTIEPEISKSGNAEPSNDNIVLANATDHQT